MVALLTGGNIHASDIAKKFYNMLDLEQARPVVEDWLNFWPHYDHLVKNRKSCIVDLACNAITHDKIQQIIIPGSGLDTLSLEIHARHPDCKIFEIDLANMDTKTAMLLSIDKTIPDSIRCITSDLSDSSNVASNLVKHGWDSNLPSLLILEGITYYLTVDVLWKIICMLQSNHQTNRVIMEYLIPYEMVPDTMRPFAQYPFELIANETNLDHITKYDISAISAHVRRLGGDIVCHYTMEQMQQNRVPNSTLFSPPNTGWIEVCMLSI